MYKLPNGKIVYPEDIECVHDPVNGRGGIFIGNLEAAENLQTLKKHGIKAVLTAAKGVFLNHPKTEIPYQLYIPGEDHEKFDISKFFSQSIAFIRDALQKTNILVHCLAGVSRSVSLVMAYFIKYHNMGYDNVYTKIKSRRKIIHPNDGFIAQLRRFESECREKGPVVQRSNEFEMRCSYSPSKRHDRQGFEGFQPSPQKFYESPQKRYTKNLNDFRYTQLDRNGKFNHLTSMNNVRNPQLYKSIVNSSKIDKMMYNQENSLRAISPDRQDRMVRAQSGIGYKRASMQVNNDLEKPSIDNAKRSFFNQHNNSISYQRYDNTDVRGRISSDYKPLDSIQNREHDINAQIDKKIAEIRRKYQQYSKQPQNSSIMLDRSNNTGSKLQRKLTINDSSNTTNNQNRFNLQEFKLRKMQSYNQSQGSSTRQDLYSAMGYLRKDNNYLRGQMNMTNMANSNANITSQRNYIGNRLRRLQSYQV